MGLIIKSIIATIPTTPTDPAESAAANLPGREQVEAEPLRPALVSRHAANYHARNLPVEMGLHCGTALTMPRQIARVVMKRTETAEYFMQSALYLARDVTACYAAAAAS